MQRFVIAMALIVLHAEAELRGGVQSAPITLLADEVFSATINPDIMMSSSVPSDFASFCFEVPCAPQMFSEKVHGGEQDPGKHPHLGPWAVRKSYVNLMKNLQTEGFKGPNIRIGGDSADKIQFSHLPVRVDHQPPKHNNRYNMLTVQDIATYAYAGQWNGTVTIDLNILPKNTSNSVEYAVAAMQLLDPKLIDGFEIGNEPPAFGHNGDEPKGWDYGDYNRLFKRYADALQEKGKMPMPWIQGAVFSQRWQQHLDNYTRQWTTSGSVGSQYQNLLSSVSQHHYPIRKPRDATLEKMLARETAKSVTTYATNAAFARERGIPFVIGEANACVFGDHNNVCNTFATALWSVDTMCWSAISNMSRWNFHGCANAQPDSSHSPIVINETLKAAVAKPLYYGMWFYSKLTSGAAMFIDVNATWHDFQGGPNQQHQNVVVWATKTSTKMRLAILQKTLRNATAVSVLLDLGANYAGASGEILRLESGLGGMGEQHNISFAGQTLNDVTDGIPRGARTSETVHADGYGRMTLTVHPFSAILVEVDV